MARSAWSASWPGRLGCLPIDDRHVGAGVDFGPRRRELVDHPADLRGHVGFLLPATTGVEAGGAQRRAPRRSAACRSRSAPSTFCSPLETTIETVEPGVTCVPALGDWRITSPAGAALVFFGDARNEAAAADLLHRDRALGADQHRHLGQLRPVGDGERHRRARGSRWCRRTGRSGSPARRRPCRSGRSSTCASKPASSSLRCRFGRAVRPAGRRDLGAARAGADRQRHLRLRAEEAEEGAVERCVCPARRVLLEHGVGGDVALRPG